MLQKLISCVLLLVLFSACQENKNASKSLAKQQQDSLSAEVKAIPKNIKFGLDLEKFEVHYDTVKRGDFFGSILDQHKVSPQKVYAITQQIPDSVFNSRKINVGRPYAILKDKDSLTTLGMIYENSKVEATKLFFSDSIYVEKHLKPIVEKQKIASGVITSSLSQAIDDAGINYRVTSKFADIYQWSVDFFKLQKGDQFKIIYNERFIDDTVSVGIGEIDAAILKHKNREFYAFNFLVDSTVNRYDYFDENAKTLRSFFLKAPIQYSRISSRYTQKRFHPVQKRWKAHLGTDYAAPTGTPIWSTADGVVTKSGYTSGNGNYVKVKHTNKYSTQYLHMSKRAVKVGDYVKQGELIGYVGATGLATGPHVCYRFWVDGKQVDPYKQDLPDAEPMEEDRKPSYFEFIGPIKEKLDGLEYVEMDLNT
ncbi:MAG: peptidoglycan DD-metalloendopeptidase family protein [Flavobacteriaceae bacterium]|nr:peptidoglycan DD-metalloendopeptidase family protein [Flavobacteriaceae bacterium]